MPKGALSAQVTGLILVIVGALAAHRAGSQPARSVWIDYRAGSDCPSREILLERIRARTQRIVLASERASAEVSISISVAADGQQAEVNFSGTDGQHLTRAMRGLGCAEVVDGAALVVAVTLDPTIATRVESAPSAEPTSPPSTSVTPSSMAMPSSAPPQPAETPAPQTVAARSSRSSDKSAWRGVLGVGLGVASGMAPKPSPGVLVSFQLGTNSQALWAPTAWVALELDRSGSAQADGGGSVRFTRALGRVAACPVWLELGPDWGLRPCATMEAGTLRGSPTNVSGGTEDGGGWYAPGMAARVEGWTSSRLLLILDGSVTRPLFPDEFRIGGQTIERVPSVAFGAALGLGLRMPP